jgi:hypothetical protein
MLHPRIVSRPVACDLEVDDLVFVASFCGGQGRRRSVDLWFFRPALYRLSYLTSSESMSDPVGGNDGI